MRAIYINFKYVVATFKGVKDTGEIYFNEIFNQISKNIISTCNQYKTI